MAAPRSRGPRRGPMTRAYRANISVNCTHYSATNAQASWCVDEKGEFLLHSLLTSVLTSSSKDSESAHGSDMLTPLSDASTLEAISFMMVGSTL